jgi:hypothetical protein
MNNSLSLVQMNDIVFAHFQRITGSTDPFLFPRWWAEREREVIRLQCEESMVLASSRWQNLKRPEQQARLLAYLERMPRNQVVAFTTPASPALRRVA